MDFDTAWARARKNGDIYAPLFATSSYASSHSKARQRTPPAPTPVWSEYSNPDNHRYVYSPALMKQRHDDGYRVWTS